MKKLYLFLNNHMKWVAIAIVCCLIPVAVVPALGYAVLAAFAALWVIMFVGDYPMNWLKEVVIDDCPGY